MPVAAGLSEDLALTSEGRIISWGENWAQTGTIPGSLADKRVTAIDTDQSTSIALTSDGKVTMWGSGASSSDRAVPTSLDTKTVIAVDTGTLSTLALTDDGKVTAWGDSWDGLSTVPASLDDKTVTAISAGYDNNMALTSDGKVTVWGNNSAGQLDVPASLADKTVTAISAGGKLLLALTSDGDVVAWGSSATGATVVPSSAAGVTRISAGNGHNLVVVGGNVAPRTFDSAVTASITGSPRVGDTLTAETGEITPQPDTYTYRWFADDVEIPGATTTTFTPTPSQLDARITVEVSAAKAGYTSSTDTSEPTAPVSAGTGDVATDRAPSLDLDVASVDLRRGQSTTLTWTSQEATTLIASHGWTGARAAAGSATVRPTRLGATTYVLTATNDNGTTTAQVTVQVRRQARALGVTASNGLRRAGATIRVSATRMDPSETYAIRISGRTVATGTATRLGRVSRLVRVPTRTKEGAAAVSVTGSETDRAGQDTIRVLRVKRLGLRVWKKRVRASDRQRVVVTGLAAGEKVTLAYQGKRISPKGAHATRRGTYTTKFKVDTTWGTKTVKVTGQFPGRKAHRTFKVVRRCAVGHICA